MAKVEAYNPRTSIKRQENKRVRRHIFFESLIDPAVGVKRISIGLRATKLLIKLQDTKRANVPPTDLYAYACVLPTTKYYQGKNLACNPRAEEMSILGSSRDVELLSSRTEHRRLHSRALVYRYSREQPTRKSELTLHDGRGVRT